MAPRFMERINRQSETLRTLFGDPQFDPPPYPNSQSSRTTSMVSSHFEQSQQSAPPGYSQTTETTSSINNDGEQWSIPDDSLILVTGANSRLGMHVIDLLLSHGYRVRGTVRSNEKAVRTSKFFEQRHGLGRYHAAQVPDMAAKGAFDVVTRDCAGVVHVAAVTTLSSDPNEVITPSIAGAINALEAAAMEYCVKRFVYCSSMSAAVSPNRRAQSEITSESWNMLDFDEAWAPPPYDPGRTEAVHASEKMQTEAAVWRWYGRRQPTFELNTVLPGKHVGRTLEQSSDGSSVTSSLRSFSFYPSMLQQKLVDYGRGIRHSAAESDTSAEIRTVAPPPTYTVQIEDSALLHVAALLLSDVRNQRIFATPVRHPPLRSPSPVQPVRAYFPDQSLPSGFQDTDQDRQALTEMDKAEELLRRMGRKGWRES